MNVFDHSKRKWAQMRENQESGKGAGEITSTKKLKVFPLNNYIGKIVTN